MTLQKLTKSEKIVVSYTVLLTLWAFFTGFHLAYNDLIGGLLGGRIGLLLYVGYFFTLMRISKLQKNIFDHSNDRNILFLGFTFIVIYILTWISAGVSETIFLFAILHVAGLLLLRDDLKLRTFDMFVKVLALILLVSLIEFLIYFIFGKGVVIGYVERPGPDMKTQKFYQLLFNLIIDNPLFFYRFQSLAEEPGVVGTTCAFLIFLVKGKKQYKWEYFIFILSGVLSFSLAFYFLFIIHLFSGKLSIKLLIVSLVVCVILYYVFQDFLDHFIINRLTDRSIEEIDNRGTGDFKYQFKRALDNGNLWLGIYHGDGIDGAGLKIFIWRYGLISLFLIFISYSIVFFKGLVKYKTPIGLSLVFFLVFWISFYQRHYITSMEYMVCYFLAPLILKDGKQS